MARGWRYLGWFLWLGLSLGSGALLVQASETSGQIASGSYAWGENLGWISFSCAHCGLSITDEMVSGYAWSPTSGWINFQPLLGGVRNTAEGVLAGHAWSEQFGWIDFAGVTIGHDGIWRGLAGQSGQAAGRINFVCESCSVTTDWRPLSRRQPSLTSSGGGGGGRRKTPILASSTALRLTEPLDIIRDGAVDVLDFNRLMVEWGRRGNGLLADLTLDTIVDLFDFNRLMVEWGKRYAWVHY